MRLARGANRLIARLGRMHCTNGVARTRFLRNDHRVHLQAGAIVDTLDLEGLGTLTARYTRGIDGWTATFTLTADGNDDLAIQHRLVAPTLADARRAVPLAAAFLAGDAIDDPRAL
jgi:hypothetical protein